jgi:AcrR family transcriptional regulator
LARNKQVSDEDVVEAAMKGVINRGAALTLAEIGAEVDLSAATVVQRFGTKRELMRRVVELRRQRVLEVDFRGEGDPVNRIIAGLSGLLTWLTVEQVANVSAVLHTHVADPEFRELVSSGYRDQRSMIRATLDEAIAAGQIRPCDTEVVARLMQVTVLGAQQSWAVEPSGELGDWVSSCLWTCIDPLLLNDEDLVLQA